MKKRNEQNSEVLTALMLEVRGLAAQLQSLAPPRANLRRTPTRAGVDASLAAGREEDQLQDGAHPLKQAPGRKTTKSLLAAAENGDCAPSAGLIAGPWVPPPPPAGESPAASSVYAYSAQPQPQYEA